jgi:hypothetical protein
MLWSAEQFRSAHAHRVGLVRERRCDATGHALRGGIGVCLRKGGQSLKGRDPLGLFLGGEPLPHVHEDRSLLQRVGFTQTHVVVHQRTCRTRRLRQGSRQDKEREHLEPPPAWAIGA